jgi:undecaprenyl-diphosphatase
VRQLTPAPVGCTGVSWLQVMVLGLLQGLTEFLPISSSGHLRIASEIFFDDDAGAAFTAVLQLGTEAAVLIYFAQDIGHLAAIWFRGFGSAQIRATPDYRLAWLVIIGIIPIGVLGVLFEHQIQTSGRNLWIIAGNLIVFGLVLGAAELYGRQRRNLEELSVTNGVSLGFAQAMALVPGVSRSGGTISAGLALGLTRSAAVRYSFLLAIPAVTAAGLFQIPDVFTVGGPGLHPSAAQMVIATLIAFTAGYATIAWLLHYVQRHSIYLFVWYRLALGVIVLALLATGTISAT